MILAKLRVNDFEQFWSVFSDRGAKQRASFGSKGSQVLRSGADRDELWILFDWDEDGYRRFVADANSRQLMSEAGLQGPPEPVFVDQAGALES